MLCGRERERLCNIGWSKSLCWAEIYRDLEVAAKSFSRPNVSAVSEVQFSTFCLIESIHSYMWSDDAVWWIWVIIGWTKCFFFVNLLYLFYFRCTKGGKVGNSSQNFVLLAQQKPR